MSDPTPIHVFDQTNGVVSGLDGDSDGTAASDYLDAADRADGDASYDRPSRAEEDAVLEQNSTETDAGAFARTDPDDASAARDADDAPASPLDPTGGAGSTDGAEDARASDAGAGSRLSDEPRDADPSATASRATDSDPGAASGTTAGSDDETVYAADEDGVVVVESVDYVVVDDLPLPGSDTGADDGSGDRRADAQAAFGDGAADDEPVDDEPVDTVPTATADESSRGTAAPAPVTEGTAATATDDGASGSDAARSAGPAHAVTASDDSAAPAADDSAAGAAPADVDSAADDAADRDDRPVTGLAALIGDESIGHVFDQTNGVIDGADGDSDGTAESDERSDADRHGENEPNPVGQQDAFHDDWYGAKDGQDQNP